MSATYTVKTRDVDCSTSRNFKTLKAAVARFESMYGHSIQCAIDNMAVRDDAEPRSVEDVRFVHGVSDYGTVVRFERVGG